jgi:hypothetical protein
MLRVRAVFFFNAVDLRGALRCRGGYGEVAMCHEVGRGRLRSTTAGIGRSMIHDGVGRGRSMIHDAGGGKP